MSRDNHLTATFSVDPQTPTRTIRHQSSLEHVFNFTLSSPQPTPAQADEALFIYNEILNDCESAGLFLEAGESYIDGTRDKVFVHNVFRALIQFCPHDTGRLNLVRMILHGLFSADKTTSDDRSLRSILPVARAWLRANKPESLHSTLEAIAGDFIMGFFVPLTAQASCTPSVSGLLSPPTIVASTQGTPHRLRGLRRTCLQRDGSRCVVTGLLDKEVHRRTEKHSGTYGVLTEAAHIIPHSLNAVRSVGDVLSSTKSFVWQILNMFDTGISTELEGGRIDAPSNAMILAHDLHDEFGKLRCYLEEVGLNSYVFRKTRDAAVLAPGMTPKPLITFVNHEPEGTLWADLPSARLLKLHAACCKMMEMAGAAEYVESVIEDLDRMEEHGTLAANGSSDLGMLLRIKGLCGWSGDLGDEEDAIKECAAVELVQG